MTPLRAPDADSTPGPAGTTAHPTAPDPADGLQPLTLVTPGGAESPRRESFGGPDRLRI
jgi:hypothetical protein